MPTRLQMLIAVLFCAPSIQCWAATDSVAAAELAARCASFEARLKGHWPDASTRTLSAQWVDAGPLTLPASMAGPALSLSLPAHCDVSGLLQERVGEGGQNYAIRFHLRLPQQWNGRLLFQGGGGSNGVVGNALGQYSASAAPALTQGYAVVSQDSGHDNTLNNDPARGGVLVFGFDEQARANYGYASLPLVSRAAKAAAKSFYSQPVRHSYFIGCSKGGEEGLALAERFATEFDGIVANSPGLSLPRAAIAEAWDTQSLTKIVAQPGEAAAVPLTRLSTAFSDSQLQLVRAAVLEACDASDGLKDGMVGDFRHCTLEKVQPQLKARQCAAADHGDCLSEAQIQALVTLMQGPKDSTGNALYSDWAWDAGIGLPGWRIWKMGGASGQPPSLNVLLGGASLASDFTTPPTPLGADPQQLYRFLLSFDFDRDAPKINATSPQFPRSAWDDISARSSDLGGFRAHGGKLIIVQGVSDPVFSINDTLAWWDEVNQRNAGRAARFVRVFPVPGMNHCAGGDATDEMDLLPVLVNWVEHKRVPDSILAHANARSAWPNRTRPLCPYPQIARYKGSGDPDSAENFSCRLSRG